MPRPLIIALEQLFISLEDLIESGQHVVDNWETGDLAAAVTQLNQRVSSARTVLTQGSTFGFGVALLPAQPSHERQRKNKQFNAVLAQIPHYCAVFQVRGTNAHMQSNGLRTGNEVRFYEATSELAWYKTEGHPTLKDGSISYLVDITPTLLLFLKYELVDEFPWDTRRRTGQETSYQPD